MLLIPVCTGRIGTRLFLPAGRPRQAIRISCLPRFSRQPPCVPQKPYPIRQVGLPERCWPHSPKTGSQMTWTNERTWLVILANVWAGISPAVTLRRKPGLFLSLRFTNNVRILDLYVVVVPLESLYTVSSTRRARCNMRSDAGHYVSNAGLGLGEEEDGGQGRGLTEA